MTTQHLRRLLGAIFIILGLSVSPAWANSALASSKQSSTMSVAAPVVAIPIVLAAQALYSALSSVLVVNQVYFNDVPWPQVSDLKRVTFTSKPRPAFPQALPSSQALALKTHLNALYAQYNTAKTTLEYMSDQGVTELSLEGDANDAAAQDFRAFFSTLETLSELDFGTTRPGTPILRVDLPSGVIVSAGFFRQDDIQSIRDIILEVTDPMASALSDTFGPDRSPKLSCSKGAVGVAAACQFDHELIESIVVSPPSYWAAKLSPLCQDLGKAFYQGCSHLTEFAGALFFPMCDCPSGEARCKQRVADFIRDTPVKSEDALDLLSEAVNLTDVHIRLVRACRFGAHACKP